ncbi:Tfp pilus assembly protein FimT/FimU [Eggerthella sp. YY7918]|uniref:pilus assembly FimT family protein n=1 Tax=Eggerthella sp. (strain YY7918) TaxID=502558 RepID=UPI0002171022|nr:type II secretion system protein [Eggerthella sp. YY7918]BAK43375.1 RTX toxin [Eggerthella sp. YY7918]
MTFRQKHTDGFTLAELLLTIAIVLVLCAIAIPSFISAHNNMRMVELDNAAKAIADAAQTQMTAQKNGGTWLALIGGESGANGKASSTSSASNKTGNATGTVSSGAQAPGNSSTNIDTRKFPSVINPTSGAPADTYYMTADQARSLGIVPSLSVDDQVRESDYIIEFTASTANVVSVFFADGKNGFFDSAHPDTTAARDYYTSSGSRAQETRKAASPMIGYYEGTPSGATSQKALLNPVIWVDTDSGRLCVQDPNLSVKESKRNTASTVRIQKKDGTQGFELSGLYEGFNTLTVSAVDDSDNPERIIISSDKVPEVVKLLDREGLPQGDVFYIDLNALTRILVADNAGKAESALVNLIASFKPAEEVQVEVTTTLSDTPKACIPSTARATIEWPAAVGRLTVLVSTPWSEALAKDPAKPGTNPEHLDGSNYTQPIVKATTTSGGTAQTVAKQDEAEDLSFKASDINNTLIGTNKQAGWQSYVGASVGYAQAAADPTFVLNAQVGAYKSHQYQIWELWAQEASGNYTRVGALRNGVWQWTNAKYSRLDDALTWNDTSGKVLYETIGGQSTEGVASISVQAINWGSTLADLGLADADGNATFFVRTAPAASEVQAYFSREILNGSLQKDMGSYEKISARGINQTTKTQVGIKFEQEFGASSADVAWSVAHGAETGFDNGNLLMKDSKRNSMRVYYALTPGLGFKNIQAQGDPLGGLRSTEITNASLWAYLANENGQMEEQPTAVVRAEVPGDYRFTATGGATDFELKTTEDHRFYRVITYYDDDGSGNLTRLKTPAQYVPYTAMSSDGAIIAASPGDKKVGDTEYIFDGWKSWEEGTWVTPGSRVADYDAALSYWGTKLVAQYHEKPKPSIGLMYLEFDNNGAVSGWKGSLAIENQIEQSLPDANAIAEWGYYVVVPVGSAKPQATSEWQNVLLDGARTITFDGSTYYDAYQVSFRSATYLLKKQAQTITCILENKQDTYYINDHFAAAITRDSKEASRWGTKKESPFVVRHAQQLPMASWLADDLMQPYMQPANSWDQNQSWSNEEVRYQQTHDISLAGMQLFVPYSFDKRVYDGNGFVIWDIDYTGINSNHLTSVGLFPQATKSEFKDITIAFTGQAQSGVIASLNGSDQGFGFLIGSASGCEFKRCCVFGVDEIGNAQIIRLQVENWVGHVSMGGLVGIAADNKIEFEDCQVDSIRLVTNAAKLVDFGGLVGLVNYGKVEIEAEDAPGYFVSNTHFVAEAKANTIGFGGFVGFAGGNVEIKDALFDATQQVANDPEEQVANPVGRTA